MSITLSCCQTPRVPATWAQTQIASSFVLSIAMPFTSEDVMRSPISENYGPAGASILMRHANPRRCSAFHTGEVVRVFSRSADQWVDAKIADVHDDDNGFLFILSMRLQNSCVAKRLISIPSTYTSTSIVRLSSQMQYGTSSSREPPVPVKRRRQTWRVATSMD